MSVIDYNQVNEQNVKSISDASFPLVQSTTFQNYTVQDVAVNDLTVETDEVVIVSAPGLTATRSVILADPSSTDVIRVRFAFSPPAERSQSIEINANAATVYTIAATEYGFAELVWTGTAWLVASSATLS